MLRVKIYGAGSIGNHLANASRQLGWDVTVCDVSEAALNRMREEIYPARYGTWDPAIQLCTNDNAPQGGFDLILVGTPPEYHLPLAVQALAENPRAIMVEKPVCQPSLELAQTLCKEAGDTKLFVGYDHVVSRAVTAGRQHLADQVLGQVHWIDVEFREHWKGIFAAHPWLSGPSDTYLGYWQRGGGASGEHSHALNLWQHLAHVCDGGRVSEVDAKMVYESHDQGTYDSQCMLNLQTEAGLVGRVVQDVVTFPPSKRAVVHGERGSLQIVIGYKPGCDAVILQVEDVAPVVAEFPKTRPDDFIQELRHIAAHLEDSAPESPISLARGLDTMLVIAAAHESDSQSCRMQLDYQRGYLLEAVSACPAKAQPHPISNRRCA
ncbi:Oxidoreductase family, NAD-binding Rossmann fold [Bremerella volcania]|uniref:Oxidoreductase family, NAD-binding Rossmann fold n=1 Tax=Bremerella volcania TaxID=2527984 RepID=A0A518C390_9BACT|nr:Gfo/Idh/MocA family oxidoreductase [Bremerella volcania]QDU73689.1 Oxidoreductase family, NAD-binding Rossmann fold [Bremerella volcania]